MSEKEKYEYLLNTYCKDELERKYMCEWINARGVHIVYDIVSNTTAFF